MGVTTWDTNHEVAMRCEEATSKQAGKPCFSGLNFAIAIPIGNMAPGLLWGKDGIFVVLPDFGVKLSDFGVKLSDFGVKLADFKFGVKLADFNLGSSWQILGSFWGQDGIFGGWVQMNDDECDGWM